MINELKELGCLPAEASAQAGRRIAFSLVVLVYLGFLGVINVLMFLPGNWISAMGHFDFFYTGDTHDLIHELVFALIVGTAAVGLFSQLCKPKGNFAGQLVALIAWAVMILTAAFTNNWVPQPLFIIFGGLTILATILHPAGRNLFNWVRTTGLSRALLTLVIIAAVPLLVFSATNISLQIAGGETAGLFGHNPPAFHGGVDSTTPSDTYNEGADEQKHVALGHYRNIAVLSFIIILIGILASFSPPAGGWRLAAWVTGFLPILLGLSSVVLPDAESSLGVAWGLAAIVWGIVFIAVAEVTRRKEFAAPYFAKATQGEQKNLAAEARAERVRHTYDIMPLPLSKYAKV